METLCKLIFFNFTGKCFLLVSGSTSNKKILAVITLSQQKDKNDVLPNSSSGFGLCLTVSVYVRDQTKLIPKPKSKLKFRWFSFVQIPLLVDFTKMFSLPAQKF